MNQQRYPLVSIIIPVYNDPEGIEATLSSVSKNTPSASQDYEVLVVDNGSTDSTRDVIRQFISENPRIKLLTENEIQSSYAARNRGIRGSKGRILVFIDANMTVDDNWFSNILKTVERNDAQYFGCNVDINTEDYNNSLVAEYNELTAFPIKRYLDNDKFVPTCCLIVSDNLISDVGDFDDRMISGGDMEFGHRVHEAGFNQKFEDNITVYHPARPSLREVLEKMFRVGRGLAQYSHFHPERFDKPIWRQLGGYLPPHPRRFHQKMKYEYEIRPLWKILAFYFLNYAIRLTRTCGAIYQIIYIKSNEERDVADSKN